MVTDDEIQIKQRSIKTGMHIDEKTLKHWLLSLLLMLVLSQQVCSRDSSVDSIYYVNSQFSLQTIVPLLLQMSIKT